MKFPDFFKIKTAQQPGKSFIPLSHRHLTTTDFFKMQPICARELIPSDDVKVDVTSFVRFFPMPFPVFGRVKYYNRCFFVPNRQIMEGFTSFINDLDYPQSNGFIRIQKVPYFTNKDICDAFYSSYADHVPDPLIDPINYAYYWRKYNDQYQVLVTNLGKVATYTVQATESSPATSIVLVRDSTGIRYYLAGESLSIDVRNTFGQADSGTATITYNYTTNIATIEIDDSYLSDEFTFQASITPGSNYHYGDFDPAASPGTDISSTPFEDVKYDFKFGSTPFRFTNRGRFFYTVLCSLGYRVDWRNDGSSFVNTQQRSALKLLAWVKVYLDYYSPAAYATNHKLQMLFYGVSSAGRHITYGELLDIAAEIMYVTYDRDYFTSAWQNPTGPNVVGSRVDIHDTTIVNRQSGNRDYRSVAHNNGGEYNTGSLNGTPSISGEYVNASGGIITQDSPYNISYYILETLRALTNWTRRNQLSGNRVVDRHLANFGQKLSDDRSNRCYYIGGYSYDADIMDIMSTADTPQAALGDYAGKGIAYSDAHREFSFEADEHGILIVISSVVPEIGYVQGVMRENMHLTRMDFFQGDFDNLGTQAQRNDELFADCGMPMPSGEDDIPYVLAPDGVRGFVPRYAEYKVGQDFLTGDFNVPSRREGLDAYHLFRLFNNPNIPSINKSFQIGEQEQYDRIFNNTDSDYDHMYIVHNCQINARRPMKSISEVYDFEHSDGREMEVSANGSQLN